MDEMITWLRGRLDERERELADDERVALAALHEDAVRPGEWMTEHHNSKTHSEPNRCHIAEDRSGHYWSVAQEVFIPNAEHIARHDPARVLDEVKRRRRGIAGKRVLLDEYASWDEEWQADSDPVNSQSSFNIAVGMGHAIKLLAQEFDGEPGWQDGWKA